MIQPSSQRVDLIHTIEFILNFNEEIKLDGDLKNNYKHYVKKILPNYEEWKIRKKLSQQQKIIDLIMMIFINIMMLFMIIEIFN